MSTDPREPLSNDEATLARVYAALPRPEPPPALDAKILAQAREAIAPTAARRRRRPWFLMPGAGVAAAAVLAAGLAWQVGILDDGHMQGVSTMPAPAKPAASTPAADAANEAPVPVEFMRREQAPPAADAKADAETALDERKSAPPPAARPTAPASRAARAPEAFPQQAPLPVVTEEATPMSAPAPAPQPPAAELGASRADAAQAIPQDGETLDRIEVTGSRIKRVDVEPTVLPPWPQDAALAPDAWIERVRERIRAGDREAARFSLRRFTRVHPGQPVPDDLTLLLVQ